MTPFLSPYIHSEMIFKLDAQLSDLKCCAVHVIAGPYLVAISWDHLGPVKIEHPELDSYVHAELIAQRVNALACCSDHERSQIVAAWEART
jgi:hypothetical protein